MNAMPSQLMPCPEIARQKDILRAKMRARRAESCPHHRLSQSLLIAEKIDIFLQNKSFQNAGAYLATQYEVDLDALIARWFTQGKDIYLPHLGDFETPFHLFQSYEALEIGVLGLRQPRIEAPAIDAALLDVVILPGLAFDAQGGRLGQGGGWYDRLLGIAPKSQHQLRIGVCYDEQIVNIVPRDSFDITMDAVITATRIRVISDEERVCHAERS